MTMTAGEAPGAGYLDVLQALTADGLDTLASVTTPDVRFRDPFNDVRGQLQMRRVFARMFDDVADLRFRVAHAACQRDQGLVLWTFSGRLRRLGNRPVQIDGVAHLLFDAEARVRQHIDYWDPSEVVYDQIPLLAPALRWVRRRLAVSEQP